MLVGDTMALADVEVAGRIMSYNVGMFASGVVTFFGISSGMKVINYLESYNLLREINHWQIAILGTEFSNIQGLDLYMLGFMGGEFIGIE
jgi:hypothetical protein